MQFVRHENYWKRKVSWLYLCQKMENCLTKKQLIWLKISIKTTSFDRTHFMPGKKGKVRKSKNIYEQKRQFLCNLNELYIAFKFEYPDIKIGLCKFYSLHPK